MPRIFRSSWVALAVEGTRTRSVVRTNSPYCRKPLKILDNLGEPKCGGDYITQKFARSTAINFSSGGNLVFVLSEEGLDEVNCREFMQVFGFLTQTYISNGHLK